MRIVTRRELQSNCGRELHKIISEAPNDYIIHYVLSAVGCQPISPVSSCERAIHFCFYSSLASQRNCGEGDDKAERDTCVPIVERAAEAEP